MAKYLVTYRYDMIGTHIVEANSTREAREEHFSSDYGDNEEIIIGTHRVSKINKISNKNYD